MSDPNDSQYPIGQSSQRVQENLRDWNRLLVKLLNYFISSEIPMGRFSFSNRRISIILAKVRLLAFIMLAIKFALLIILEGCEYVNVRRHLGDWTILYPASRRQAQTKVFFVVSLIQLATKRSLFIRDPFDSSLFDFLTELPEEEKSARETYGQWRDVKTISTTGAATPELARKKSPVVFAFKLADMNLAINDFNSGHRTLNSFLPWSCRGRISRASPVVQSHLWSSDGGSHQVEHPNIGINRDMEHWHKVGLKLRRWFTYASIIYVTLLGIPMLGAVARMGILKNSSSCDQDPFLVRFLGAAELFFLMSELLLTGIGTITGLFCVCEDINHQITTIKRYYTDSFPLEVNIDKRTKNQTSLILSRWCTSGGRIYESSNLSHKRPSDLEQVHHQLDISIHSASDESDNLSLNRLRELQRKIVAALACLEKHQKLLSFLGDYSYLWFLTCLSFVPLIVTVKANTGDQKIAITIYYAIITSSSVCYFIFAIVSANLNHNVTSLAKPIFDLCARYQDRSITLHWDKILYVWFCPPRCAVRVLGLLDLTHVNILRSLSYLLSGMTLVLNFLER